MSEITSCDHSDYVVTYSEDLPECPVCVLEREIGNLEVTVASISTLGEAAQSVVNLIKGLGK